MVLDVDRSAIMRFRLSRHHLDRRLPAGSLVETAAVSGIQETSRRTAGLAVHARVAGLDSVDLDHALRRGKTVVMVWAMRGAPYIVPVGDAAVFTTGALPMGEASLKTFFGGWAAPLTATGLSLAGLVTRAADTAREVLDGRQLPVNVLRDEIADRMPQIRGLRRPSGAHADLPEPLFRAAGQTGAVCITDSRRMTDALLARTDQWLGQPPAELDPADARAELLRRFLRCYGPSTPRAFAEWTTRHVSDADRVFASIRSELVEVSADGSAAWMLAADVETLAMDSEAAGVRLLPPQDPYLQQRDRERVLADPAHRRRLWRPVGGPGLVLVDGQAAGVWTSTRRGSSVRIAAEPFASLAGSARQALATEADSVARLRGAARSTLDVLDTP
jgi:hypothetical protein